MPRHRPASLRRVLPVLVVLALVAAGLLAASLKASPKPPARTSGKTAAVSPQRATATPEPRKQRTRAERPAAPGQKV